MLDRVADASRPARRRGWNFTSLEGGLYRPEWSFATTRKDEMRALAPLLVSLVLLTAAGCSDGDGRSVGGAGAGGNAGTGTDLPIPTEQGTPTGAKITQTIGANGGVVTSSDGLLALDFPPGALSEDTEIGIEPITNEAPLGQGEAYRLTPDGATFAKPVKLTFRYADADHQGSSPEALAVAFQNAQGRWRRLDPAAIDEANGTVSAGTTHFTDFSRVLGWQLVPFQATVSPGDSLELRLKYCEPEVFSDPNGGDDLVGLVPRCDLENELPPLVTVNRWAVNGATGGSLGDGVVSGRGTFATYQAPLAPPRQNPVAVSCEFNRGRGTNTAVANVFIGPGGWEGEIRWTLTGSHESASSGTSQRYSVNGEGMIQVRPGPAGIGEVASASSSYSYNFEERATNSYVQNCCNVSYIQTRTETLQGTSTMGASVFIIDTGAGQSITMGLPIGETTGLLVTHADETRSPAEPCGENKCSPPAPTHLETPTTGAMPSHALMFTAAGTATRLQGTETLRFDGLPPVEYTVTYNLSQ